MLATIESLLSFRAKYQLLFEIQEVGENGGDKL